MATGNKTYDRFDAAFKSVSAYVIFDPSAPQGRSVVGRVGIKHGNAGVTAYVQFYGFPMAVGRAGGGGYDRVTAAVHAACDKLAKDDECAHDIRDRLAHGNLWKGLKAVAASPSGERWIHTLTGAGFVVAGVFG